ncbi:MAG: NapC/NirT family cytochrome c [Xanthomonadales bacterium]|nr:NapC/NirT family cytochrome c [Xanthomonadales bacterium]
MIATVATVGWLVIDTGLHATGGYDFCTSCHSTMAPIGLAYEDELHGGNNPAGWRAECVDCHLPHGNSLSYLLSKTRHGIVDPWVEMTTEPLEIDWHTNRERREEYVYDSGCLTCHQALETTSMGNPKAFRPHRDYFAGESGKQCVSCHQHVGHRDLGTRLEEFGWRKPI